MISRVLKARSKQNQTKPKARSPQHSRPDVATNQPEQKRPFSFEDILKEFERNLSDDEYTEEKPLPVEEIKHQEPKPVQAKKVSPKPSPYKTYEGTTYESPAYDGKEEMGSTFSRSEKYSLKQKIAGEYIKMLQDPDGAKNAIVLSEIINRKYF